MFGDLNQQTGVCRLALSDLDKKVRDWFVQETEKLGCQVKIDEMGNIFAIYPGKTKVRQLNWFTFRYST